MNDSTEVRLHFLDYWRVVKNRAGIIFLTFLLVVITAGVTTYFLPREYYSRVSMEVKPDTEKTVVFGTDSSGRGSDARFAPTQFNILQKKEILYPVLDELKLAEKWLENGKPMARERAYRKLLRMMDLREVRNTDLIEVGVYSTDRQEAAEIANRIGVVYQEKRRSDMRQRVTQSMGELRGTNADQRRQVDEAYEDAKRIRVRDNIVDLNPDTIETTLGTENTAVMAAETRASEAKAKVNELESQLAQVEKLKPEELMVALRILQIEDPTVAKILPLYQDAVSNEAGMLQSGLGDNHPRVRALRAQKEVYKDQLAEQLDSIRGALKTRQTIAQNTLLDLDKEVRERREKSIDTRSQSAEYAEAKNKYITAKRILEAAEMRVTTTGIEQSITSNPAKIWEMAEPALSPSKPNVPAYMALAVLIGLVIGVGLAFFLEYLDTSVKTLDDIEKFLGIPVLGVIPKNVEILMNQTGDSADAEAYRILRTNIEFNKKNPDANTITIISGGPGEGKSTTLNNLAFTCAKGGYNVLLVDADLRRPSQHRIFDVPNDVGLTNYLKGEMELEEVIKATPVPNLSFMPSGLLPQDAVGILNSQRLPDMVAALKNQYDLVLFDSPPILGVSDASILASEVDITIMVVQHRRFPRSMLERVKQSVLNVGGNLIGVVLNNVDGKNDDAYQYYTQYYDYYTPEKSRGSERGARRPAETAAVRNSGSTRSKNGGDDY